MAEEHHDEIEEAEDAAAALSDAAGIAVALDEARRRRKSGAVDAFLKDQRALIGDQRHHLKEQLKQLRLRLWSDRLKLAQQAATLVLAACIAGTASVLIWQATQSHALVIEALSVPPDLAQQGLSGQTLARQLQDHLTELQEATASARATASFERSWSHDLKVEIPDTGLSLSELDRFLNERFGHDTHITGEVFHDGDGLTLSVRSDDQTAARVSGEADSIDQIIDNGARQLFAKTQPYQYAIWLGNHGRQPEANTIFTALAASPVIEDRLWALNGLAIAADTPRAAREFEAKAVQADPSFSHGWLLIGRADLGLGWAEAALADSRRGLVNVRRDRGRRVAEQASDWEKALGQGIIGEELSDSFAMTTALDPMVTRPDAATSRYYRSAQFLEVAAWAWRHEPDRARALLAGTPDDVTANLQLQHVRAEAPYAWIAAERGDWAEVARQIEAVRAAKLSPPVAASLPPRAWPLLAEAYAHLGRRPEALAVLNAIPADAYDGWIARGRVAALGGEAVAADRAFAQAVSLGPSLPRAYKAWGDTLLARGNIDGALAMYAEANQRGPHWADPLKAWGDALVKQGKVREAVLKYDKALQYAPRWGELRQARAAAGRGASGLAALMSPPRS